jgi:hypothetical protein
MKKIFLYVAILVAFGACNNSGASPELRSGSSNASSPSAGGHWEGAFSNGMKQTYISFDVSSDGKTLSGLTFKGYWRCSGKLELTTLGPSKTFPIVNGKVDGISVEPENGGSTAMRFEIHGAISGKEATGTFRINLNALGCDTYKLNWTAHKK